MKSMPPTFHISCTQALRQTGTVCGRLPTRPRRSSPCPETNADSDPRSPATNWEVPRNQPPLPLPLPSPLPFPHWVHVEAVLCSNACRLGGRHAEPADVQAGGHLAGQCHRVDGHRQPTPLQHTTAAQWVRGGGGGRRACVRKRGWIERRHWHRFRTIHTYHVYI